MTEAGGPRRRQRITVVTANALTSAMAGPAIRAWQVAQALAVEHEVQLVTTSRCEATSESFTVRAVTNDQADEVHDWSDVIVLQGFLFGGRGFLRSNEKVVVVDVYDPLHLEQLEQTRHEPEELRRAIVREATGVLNEQLLRGDYVLCASAKQRDFWMGHLAALGRINTLTYDDDERLCSLVGIVSFGLPEEPPQHVKPVIKGVVRGIGYDDELILWGGGIYNWLDPLTLLRAVDRLRKRRPGVRLFFMGLRHPNPDVPEMQMAGAARQLADDLGLTDTHVFFNEGWVPYHDRQNHLLEADVGVSVHLDHLETAFSYRTRVLDYVWATLPIVATQGDSWSELVESKRLGLTVPPGEPAALEQALFHMLDDKDHAQGCRRNLEALRPQLAWPEVLRPLVEFCRAPRRAPDLIDPDVGRELARGRLVSTVQRGWRHDLELAAHYMRRGGPQLLMSRAKSRVGHLLAGRR